eukprot:TRINITY_DN1446_c0_g1_i2.p1 TRINITY_DN1446_c0_g1~~TRINITY_DN1446_c0_g1_i2.p1  ORF type:complete len:645 (+),score=162.01 TRINITY_DN1446_c0_g1_i2:612-2546(+)
MKEYECTCGLKFTTIGHYGAHRRWNCPIFEKAGVEGLQDPSAELIRKPSMRKFRKTEPLSVELPPRGYELRTSRMYAGYAQPQRALLQSSESGSDTEDTKEDTSASTSDEGKQPGTELKKFKGRGSVDKRKSTEEVKHRGVGRPRKRVKKEESPEEVTKAEEKGDREKKEREKEKREKKAEEKKEKHNAKEKEEAKRNKRAEQGKKKETKFEENASPRGSEEEVTTPMAAEPERTAEKVKAEPVVPPIHSVLEFITGVQHDVTRFLELDSPDAPVFSPQIAKFLDNTIMSGPLCRVAAAAGAALGASDSARTALSAREGAASVGLPPAAARSRDAMLEVERLERELTAARERAGQAVAEERALLRERDTSARKLKALSTETGVLRAAHERSCTTLSALYGGLQQRGLSGLSTEEVCLLLREAGLGAYADHFRACAIDGAKLGCLRDGTLRQPQLAVNAFNERKRLLYLASALKSSGSYFGTVLEQLRQEAEKPPQPHPHPNPPPLDIGKAEQWTSSDVRRWLLEQGQPATVADQFAKHDVQGWALLHLTWADLESLNLCDVLQCDVLKKLIKKLSKQHKELVREKDKGKEKVGSIDAAMVVPPEFLMYPSLLTDQGVTTSDGFVYEHEYITKCVKGTSPANTVM